MYRGSSLMETLVVISIIGVLALLAPSLHQTFYTGNQLAAGAVEVLDRLRSAQGKSLTGETDLQWGVRLESDKVSLIRSDGQVDEVYQLPNGVSLSDLNINGGGYEIYFDKISGITNQNGTFSLRNNFNQFKAFTVSAQGVVQIQ